MGEILTLLYIILTLQILLTIFIIGAAIFSWLKVGRDAVDIITTADSALEVVNYFLSGGVDDKTGVSRTAEVLVSEKSELVRAVRKEFTRIMIIGALADWAMAAFTICSEPNLVKIHQAFLGGPDALRQAAIEMNADPEIIREIKDQLGASLAAKLVIHYGIAQTTDTGILLMRKG